MDENGICDEPRGRPRGRPRGKQRSRARVGSRTAKTTNKRRLTESDDGYEEDSKPETEVDSISAIQFDKDCDISALEAPTFTTLDRGPPAPMLQLSWDHSVSLIGEKVLSPRIHSCDTCDKPILIYGRMIPCKHIFCLTCAKSEDRACSRCGERVIRVEQTGLGTVFMCNFTINEALCKRTYLSQRDLQAHIDHRHIKNHLTIPTKEDSKELFINSRDPRAEVRPGADGLRLANNNNSASGAVPTNDPRSSGHPAKDINTESALTQFPRTFNPGLPPPSLEASSPRGAPIPHHHIPVMTASRTNLITVALHEPPDSPFAPTPTPYPQPPPSLHHPRAAVIPPPPPHSLPPPTHPFNSPPPISQPPPSHFPPPPAVTSTSYASSFPLRSSSTSSSLHHPHHHQPQQFSYSQSQASSTQQQPLIPFGAVPPPVATQFSTQWSTPPPPPQHQPPLRPVASHPITHPPPPPGTLPSRQHLLTSNPPQKGTYYR